MANTGAKAHGGTTNEKVSGNGGKFTIRESTGRDNSAMKLPNEDGKNMPYGSPYGEDPHFKGK